MKVLHILNDSMPYLSGYTVRSANIVRFQSALGLEPVVLTSPHHEPVPSEEVEIIDGIRHYRTFPKSGRRLPFLHELQVVRQMATRLDEVVRLERPDVLHAHSPCLWSEATARVAKRRKLPFVYEVRGLWEDAAVDLGKMTSRSLRYRLSRAWETRVARSADVMITIAEHLKSDFVGRGINADKILLVPNGVDAERFEPQEPDASVASKLGLNGGVCVGYVGSLFGWEGVDDLVRAVPDIVAHAPETKFVIIGGGDLEEPLRALATQLGVERYVQVLGKVPHADILRYYSVIDIVVYPRKPTRNTEHVTPLKPLEAMAMKKAVVGSNVGGIRELIAEGTGLLHRPGSPADLAKTCLQLIDHPEQRQQMGHNARAHILKTRDWRQLIATYLDAYSLATDTATRSIGDTPHSNDG